MEAHLNDRIRVRFPDEDLSRHRDPVLFEHLGKVLAARGVEKLVSLLKDRQQSILHGLLLPFFRRARSDYCGWYLTRSAPYSTSLCLTLYSPSLPLYSV
jgi:hypothetical protein